MGRGKLKMELMSNPKARNLTFQKRKKGLIKKASELSTLCDVDVCMIIYNPKQKLHSMEAETWPSNPNVIDRMIDSYNKRSEQDRSSRTLDLSDFFKDRNKKVEDAVIKLRKKNNCEAMYPTWDAWYDTLAEEGLRELSHVLKSKLEVAIARHQYLKASQIVEVMSADVLDCIPPMQSNQTQPYFMEDRNQVMIPDQLNQNPNDYYVPLPSYAFDHTDQKGLISMDSNPGMMMMMKNESYCNQFDGASSSNVSYSPMEAPIYGDPMDGGMVNNPRAAPIHYYNPMRQVMRPYVQYPGMPSPDAASQVARYYGAGDFYMNNQR